MKENIKWRLAQKIEYKWWERYLKKKNAEDYLQWKIQYWENVLQELSKYIPIPEDKLILDAGCGPAGIFIALKGNSVHAIDPLLEKYRNFPHFMPGRSSWVQFETKVIECLNEVEKYDVIFCMNAINHVNDIALCYDKLVQALKPGGYIVVSTDAHKYTFLKKFFQHFPGDVLHPVQLDNDEYNVFLTKREMDIIHSIPYEKGNVFDYYITIAKKPALSLAG